MEEPQKPYEPPTIELIGTLAELTEGTKDHAHADSFAGNVPIDFGS